MTQFKVSGGKEIARVLQEMPRQLQRRALVNAFTAGAKVVADEAKSQASGKLPDGFAQAITVRRPSSGHRSVTGLSHAVVVVGLLTPKYSKMAHWFEFGTMDRYGEDGHWTGRIKAVPFLRPALDIKAKEATQVIATYVARNIETIAKQLRSGQKISLAKKYRGF